MPRLAICSRDLHWQWINWAPLYDTMEVSMLRLTWLTVAQHVFQPALTGRLELISRKIVSCEPGTKAIAVSRFCEKLSLANWVQGVTAISRKISRSWAPKKWGPTCDRDISYSAIYATAIYRAYTVLCVKILDMIRSMFQLWGYGSSMSDKKFCLGPPVVYIVCYWGGNIEMTINNRFHTVSYLDLASPSRLGSSVARYTRRLSICCRFSSSL